MVPYCCVRFVSLHEGEFVKSMPTFIRIGLCVVFCVVFVPSLFASEGAPQGSGAGTTHHEHIGEKGASKEPHEFRTDLAIFTAVVFGLLASGLYFTAWPKILGALAAREEGIRNAIRDAEDAKVQALSLMKEHKGRLEAVEHEVKAILAEARRDAEHTKADIVKQAETEAEATKNRAIAEINRAKDQAIDELFSTLASQVSAATEQVVGRALTGSDQERLIQETVAQFARQKAL